VTATFTKLPENAVTTSEKPKQKQLSTITLRDKSIKHKSTQPKALQVKQEEAANAIKLIRESMQACTIVTFDYTANDGKRSSRNAEPYKLSTKGGKIYLYAYDIDVGGIRAFQLSSIRNVEKQDLTYEPRWKIEDFIDDQAGEEKECEKGNTG
jgi:predicted DNA-binding transcriptional regulator YafY